MDDRVVERARDWLGTPYVHQASVKGAGTDCLGLIRGIWRELYESEPEPAPMYSPDWGETGEVEILLNGATRHLVMLARSEPVQLGQVILFRMRTGAIAKHLGIVSDASENAKFIHAYNHHGVIESPLTPPWRNRIVARFRFP